MTLAGIAFAEQSEPNKGTLDAKEFESLSGPRHRSEDIRELAMLVAPNHAPEASEDLVRFLSPNSSLYDSRELSRLWDETSRKLKLVRSHISSWKAKLNLYYLVFKVFNNPSCARSKPPVLRFSFGVVTSQN